MSKLSELQSIDYWDNKWGSIFDKYQKDLRHGHYVASLLDLKIKSVLEIGAGSFRDISFLGTLGFNIGAFDFSKSSCELAKSLYPQFSDFFWCGDAFNIDLPNEAYDSSFSNGFVGCFENPQIIELVKEQMRVTKNKLIVTLHNGHNQKFVNYFEDKKKTDDLFSVRFFNIDELKEIFDIFNKPYKVYPVGKAYETDEDILIQENKSIEEIRECILAQGFSKLETSEKLMVVMDLS